MRLRRVLSAGKVGEKANPGIGLNGGIEFALHAVNRQKPDLLDIQSDHMCQIQGCGRTLDFQGPAARLTGKQLPENLDFDGWQPDALYNVSNTESRAESGISKTTLCGGRGSSRMYSGIL